MKTFTFDEICDSQEFDHNTEFILKKEVDLLIGRGDEIRNNWENNEYQEAAHYNWLDDKNEQLQISLNEAIELLKEVKEGENIYIIDNFLERINK